VVEAGRRGPAMRISICDLDHNKRAVIFLDFVASFITKCSIVLLSFLSVVPPVPPHLAVVAAFEVRVVGE